MMRKSLWVFMMLCFLALPSLAQVNPNEFSLQRFVVERAEVTVTDEGAMLTLWGSPPTCTDPLVVEMHQDNHVIVLDVSLPPGSELVRCEFIQPFNENIPLGQLEVDSGYILLVNDFASSFFIPRRDAQPQDVPALVLNWDVPNELPHQFVEPVTVTDVTLGADPNFIHVTGTHGGCVSDIHHYARTLGETTFVTVFRLLEPSMACTANIVQSEVDLYLDLPEGKAYELEFGDGQIYNYEPNTSMTAQGRLAATINDVAILWNGTAYEATVYATLPSDCGQPPIVTQYGTAYGSVINVYHNHAFNAGACPASNTPYEATFVLSGLPVLVNGVMYGNKDRFPVTPPSEEPMMQLDTVIDNVEVLYLESMPVQVRLHVTGYQPDGCEYPVTVTQGQEGNVITVRIYREMPLAVMCPAMIVEYDGMIDLGALPNGSYTIRVNDKEIQIDF